MTISAQYDVSKVRKGTNSPYFGLDVISFMIPFPYVMKTDVVVAIRGNTKNNTDDRLLSLNTHYTIDGSLLTIDEQSLNLDAKDSLDIILNITRNTDLNLAVFTPGKPIRASDLNDNFNQLVMLAEENETLIQNNIYVSDVAPLHPYLGQGWMRTPFYVLYVWDGSQWVQPQ